MPENKLFTLLNLDPENIETEALDTNEILEEIQRNPHSADFMYSFSCGTPYFPLQQAITLKAPDHVIKALCSPVAVKARCGGTTALHLALENDASADLVKFLLEKWPGAVRQKETYGGRRTPLHLACQNSTSSSLLEVVNLLIKAWPNALKEKSIRGEVPLHRACHVNNTNLELMHLMVNAWPDGLRACDSNGMTPLHLAMNEAITLDVVSFLVQRDKEQQQQQQLLLRQQKQAKTTNALQLKNSFGSTPLHLACNNNAPSNVVSFLIQHCPDDALQSKDSYGQRPLHCACNHNAPFELILVLLHAWPEATLIQNVYGETPLDLSREVQAPAVVQNVVSYTTKLCRKNEMDKKSCKEAIEFFVDIEWWDGIVLVLDRYPGVVQELDVGTKVVPDLLCMVGRRCKMISLWHVIGNMQDILGDAYIS